MKIKARLVSLILFNSLGFLLAFFIFLSFDRFLSNIEWEKKDLELLQEKIQSVRITGIEIFMDRPLEESWYSLEIQFNNLEIHYITLDRLTLLPLLSPQIAQAIETIKNLNTFTFEQYDVLSVRYTDIKTILSGSSVFSNFVFGTLYNASNYLEKNDWVKLRILADDFRTNYAHLDYILENSVRILNEELYFIETEIIRIRKISLFISLSLAFLVIGIILVFTISISRKIGLDMLRIDESLSRMISSSEIIVIDVDRKDELGDLARNIESIFNELTFTRDHLIQSEKMVSLGELVAGIAHEINTPVGIGVTASSHMIHLITDLNSHFQNEELTKEQFVSYLNDLKDSSEIVLDNMDKAAQLIKGFKQIAVDQSYQEVRKFYAREFLGDLKKSLIPLYKNRKIDIQLICNESLVINSIPGVLSQIITNLIQNSLIHAFAKEDQGLISVSFEAVEDGILLCYRDNGKGMTEKIRERIFDPFFTTKRGSGGGSGLGLHIVYNLVTQGLGGNISCESSPGKGSKFLIRFREC